MTGSMLKEPRKYNVIFHNDDFTTMDFVVSVLIEIFRKTPAEAERIMMAVHEKGRAAAGCYPLDIANTKTDITVSRARREGFPLRLTVEEAQK